MVEGGVQLVAGAADMLAGIGDREDQETASDQQHGGTCRDLDRAMPGHGAYPSGVQDS